ncbi:MAG: YvcK family protein [Acidobacteria bacterium]|nr:YvcK family protein [Acidobacteriota bacterium]
MRMRELAVGCFGGGTGLPNVLGGLKTNPWVHVHAVVTMFDSGGSSGQLRDELGVLPPGDILKCALALARSEKDARHLLLSRLPSLEHARLAGHTGGNLLLSMMAQHSGDFLAGVDGLRSLLGCRGHVWPVTDQQATICAEYATGGSSRGEVEVDAEQARGGSVTRLWLEPPVRMHPRVAAMIQQLDAVVIGPGSFYTSLLPIFLVDGAREVFQTFKGPVVYVANLLTEGRGMEEFSAAKAIRGLEEAIGRQVDVVIFNCDPPDGKVLARYAREQKVPLALGELSSGTDVVEGRFWLGAIARHDRGRLRAALWAVLAGRLL